MALPKNLSQESDLMPPKLHKFLAKKQIIKLAAIIVWMGVIFYMSSQISTTSKGMSNVFVDPLQPLAPSISHSALTFIVRKGAHTFLYFILSLLAYSYFKDFIKENRKLISVCILFVFNYAWTDEFHQLFVKGRGSEARDVLIDTAAGCLGISAYILSTKLLNRHSK